jgi:putative colanic acid biosynthesis acetyltransferase WcaF
MTTAITARRRRKVAAVDLGAYRRPVIAGNRNRAWRIAWHLCSALVFQSALALPSAWKAALLRLFGARVGRGLVVRPRVTIKYPWFLALGDHVWLGEQVWIDNHCPVSIGASVCLSQGAYLFTGNHDYDDPGFRFFCKPVTIEDGCWVGAKALVCPGSVLGRLSVIGAGVVWSGLAEERNVYLAPDATTGRDGTRRASDPEPSLSPAPVGAAVPADAIDRRRRARTDSAASGEPVSPRAVARAT